MKKSVYILMMLFFNQWLMAKVAYLPLVEISYPYPKRTAMAIMDLDTGQFLDQLEIGSRVGPVFVDDTGNHIYAAANYDKRIVLIDTRTFEIETQWNGLPTHPDKIILSEDNSKLYFLDLAVGLGINSLYQIDLINNQISAVLNYPDSSIKNVLYSEDLSHLSILVQNNTSNQLSIHTYLSNDLTLQHSTAVSNYPIASKIDNSGENFYTIDNQQLQIQSRKLSDNSLNWSFSYPGEMTFYALSEQGTTDLVISGYVDSYLINKQTGNGNPLTTNGTVGTLNDHFERINADDFVQFDSPAIVCITGVCSLGSKLNIKKVNLIDNTSETIYQSQDYLGSRPIGRFVGENFYRGTAVQQVPSLNYLSFILLLGGFIILALIKNMGLKNK